MQRLEVSCAVPCIYTSLGAKVLITLVWPKSLYSMLYCCGNNGEIRFIRNCQLSYIYWLQNKWKGGGIYSFRSFYLFDATAPPPPLGHGIIHKVSRSHITFSMTPLDEWSAGRRDLYLTTHNTHSRQTSMPSVGFEPTISVGERPQFYALDHAATWTGFCNVNICN